MTRAIRYETNRAINREEFIDVLERSTLSERRPLNDQSCVDAMLSHCSLLCTAWEEEKLVGVARSITDLAYCCYLSDLAVDQTYQKRGIGQELIRLTQSQLGPRANLILLSAPAAEKYYPKLGFTAHQSAWTISSQTKV